MSIIQQVKKSLDEHIPGYDWQVTNLGRELPDHQFLCVSKNEPAYTIKIFCNTHGKVIEDYTCSLHVGNLININGSPRYPNIDMAVKGLRLDIQIYYELHNAVMQMGKKFSEG